MAKCRPSAAYLAIRAIVFVEPDDARQFQEAHVVGVVDDAHRVGFVERDAVPQRRAGRGGGSSEAWDAPYSRAPEIVFQCAAAPQLRRVGRAQERVGRALLGQRRGDGHLALGGVVPVGGGMRAHLAHPIQLPLHGEVVGLDVRGEHQIGLRVFVPAEDAHLVGKRAELRERGEHHLGRALEEPSAARREHRVAGEDRERVVEDVRDVAARMGRNVQHARDVVADRDRVALLEAAREAGQPLAVRHVSEHGRVVALRQLGVRHRVIGVVMRREDLSHARADRFHTLHDRPHLGRVHHRRIPRRLANEQIRVVILPTRNPLDPQPHTRPA